MLGFFSFSFPPSPYMLIIQFSTMSFNTADLFLRWAEWPQRHAAPASATPALPPALPPVLPPAHPTEAKHRSAQTQPPQKMELSCDWNIASLKCPNVFSNHTSASSLTMRAVSDTGQTKVSPSTSTAPHAKYVFLSKWVVPSIKSGVTALVKAAK